MKTEVIRIQDDFRELARAAEIIKSGGLVIFPTETVYGIGADATNPAAAKKIYEAKGRPSDNPLIIHIASPADAEGYTYTSDVYYALADAFMPGPLTVVMKSRETIPLTTRGGLDTVAVRCPENPIARELIRLSGTPIAAPSANRSGSPSPTSAAHAIDDMDGRCEMIIDGGDCDFGLESTIVKIEEDGSLILLRPGKITVEDLAEAGFSVRVADAVLEELADGAVPLSPGMKYRHYAPHSPVVLLEGDLCRCVEYIRSNSLGSDAIICYREDAGAFSSVEGAVVYDFGARDDVDGQAHILFNILREIDKRDFTAVYAPLPPTDGIGLALYNRMIRAAAHKIIRL